MISFSNTKINLPLVTLSPCLCGLCVCVANTKLNLRSGFTKFQTRKKQHTRSRAEKYTKMKKYFTCFRFVSGFRSSQQINSIFQMQTTTMRHNPSFVRSFPPLYIFSQWNKCLKLFHITHTTHLHIIFSFHSSVLRHISMPKKNLEEIPN